VRLCCNHPCAQALEECFRLECDTSYSETISLTLPSALFRLHCRQDFRAFLATILDTSSCRRNISAHPAENSTGPLRFSASRHLHHLPVAHLHDNKDFSSWPSAGMPGRKWIQRSAAARNLDAEFAGIAATASKSALRFRANQHNLRISGLPFFSAHLRALYARYLLPIELMLLQSIVIKPAM